MSTRYRGRIQSYTMADCIPGHLTGSVSASDGDVVDERAHTVGGAGVA